MYIGYNPQQAFLGSPCYLGPPRLAAAVTVPALITMPSTEAVCRGGVELLS